MKNFTLHETANELGLSYHTIRTYVHYGKLKSVKQGKNRMVPQSEINRLKKERSLES